MDHIGFDLGKVNSQLCIITADGELIERRTRLPRSLVNLSRLVCYRAVSCKALFGFRD